MFQEKLLTILLEATLCSGGAGFRCAAQNDLHARVITKLNLTGPQLIILTELLDFAF